MFNIYMCVYVCVYLETVIGRIQKKGLVLCAPCADLFLWTCRCLACRHHQTRPPREIDRGSELDLRPFGFAAFGAIIIGVSRNVVYFKMA